MYYYVRGPGRLAYGVVKLIVIPKADNAFESIASYPFTLTKGGKSS